MTDGYMYVGHTAYTYTVIYYGKILFDSMAMATYGFLCSVLWRCLFWGEEEGTANLNKKNLLTNSSTDFEPNFDTGNMY